MRYADEIKSLLTGGDRPERPAEGEEEEKKEEDDWKPYIPETPSATLFAVYTSPDTFWLSMVNVLIDFLPSTFLNLG